MKNDFQIIREYQNDHTRFVFRNDYIVEVHCKNNFEYDVDQIKENISVLEDYACSGKIKIVNIVPLNTSITKKAREFLAEAPHDKYAVAEAFFISSITQQLTANFYMKINKPKLPTKFFLSFDDAVQWLKEINIVGF